MVLKITGTNCFIYANLFEVFRYKFYKGNNNKKGRQAGQLIRTSAAVTRVLQNIISFYGTHSFVRPPPPYQMQRPIEFTFYYGSIIEIIFMQMIIQVAIQIDCNGWWARLQQQRTNCSLLLPVIAP